MKRAYPVALDPARATAEPHESWPKHLKWWLVWRHARSTFYPWKTEQLAWETLLRDSLNGMQVGGGQPNPHGFTASATAAEVYDKALELAAEWRARGGRFELEEGSSGT